MKFRINVFRSGPGEKAKFGWDVHRYAASGLIQEFLFRGTNESARNARKAAEEWADAYVSADERALGAYDYTSYGVKK
ncbi:hypothetical protein ACGFZA_15895 [Streptomyces sp. NPDC048211]|uniref:hypothetical protein n=1 Tax=Streptomyces sp. NPDC048211 TaxID=3365516 RepID=UPI00371D43D5